MYKGLLVVAFLALINSGYCLECYKCDGCGNDTSKATKITCAANQQCVSYNIAFKGIAGAKKDGKECANLEDTCETYITRSRNDLANQFPDVVNAEPEKTDCQFCKDPSCNKSGPNLVLPSVVSLVVLAIISRWL